MSAACLLHVARCLLHLAYALPLTHLPAHTYCQLLARPANCNIAISLPAAHTPPSHHPPAGGEVLQRDRPLSELERDRFEDLLRQLTVERAAICEAMVFALDNADAAGEVVDILAQSLSLAETPVPLKVARLFLASDILHNSTAPGGWRGGVG